MRQRSQIKINGMEMVEIKAAVLFFTHCNKAVSEENYLNFTQEK